MLPRSTKVDEILFRGWNELIARYSGPLHFRLILQPLVAAFFAIRAGQRDAGQRRPIYFWTLLRDPTSRPFLLREGWADVGKLAVVAVLLDVVYQIIVLRTVRPVQALIVATTLAVVPYLAVRGLTNRFVSRIRS